MRSPICPESLVVRAFLPSPGADKMDGPREGREWSMSYQQDFADFEGVAYLNASLQAPLPLVSIRAAQEALEWKKRPDRLADNAYFDLPNRIREKAARLITAQPEEIAVTSGASAGLAAVAAGIDWRPGDEVLVGVGEFPAHFSTWLRYQQAGKLQIRVIEPRGRFLAAEDYLAHLGPQTRAISASLVRFDNGARMDYAPLGEACRKFGTALVLDITQFVGSGPLDIRATGATMAVASGYKWMLGPYGSGFFWIAEEWIERLPLGAVYFMALEGAHDFHSMHARPYRAVPGARRWDSPETANFTNLAAFDASLDLIMGVGLETVARYVDSLTGRIVQCLPRDRCLLASPEERERRGPYVCVSSRQPEQTAALYEKVRAANIHVSLRENALRIAPFLYNTTEEVDRLMRVLSA
jgi:selenocysteine lyase/cysteine desulfurase